MERPSPGLFSHIEPGNAAPGSGRLAGKSVLVQPNMSVRGWPTEAGSLALEGFVALEDAAAVERLRAAAANVVGSSRMAELGLGLVGDTTASAVAENLCDVALVTDTMGEARHAALEAGAFGFKPSWGIVPRIGLIGLAPSMECYGVVAKSLDDAAGVMAALAGGDERDPSMLQEGVPDFSQVRRGTSSLAVAGVIGECLDALEPAEGDAFRAALLRLESAGIRIEEVGLPDFHLFRTVHNVIGATEASSSAGKYDGVRYGHRTASAENWNEMYLKSRAESFGTLVKAYLFQGAYFQFENYAAFENACRLRRRLVGKTEALFEKVDVLVSPTRRAGLEAAAATTIQATYDAFALSLPANVTGQPALSLPGIAGNGDFELGLQLVGRHLADVQLLAMGARLALLEP